MARFVIVFEPCSNETLKVRSCLNSSPYLLILLVCEFDRFKLRVEDLLCDILIHRLKHDDQLLKVFIIQLLFKDCTDGDADLHEEGVAKVQVRVPQPRADIKAEDVREESDDPFEEEYAALNLEVDHELSEAWDALLQESHVAVEEDIDLWHVKGVEVVEQVSVHHVSE